DMLLIEYKNLAVLIPILQELQFLSERVWRDFNVHLLSVMYNTFDVGRLFGFESLGHRSRLFPKSLECGFRGERPALNRLACLTVLDGVFNRVFQRFELIEVHVLDINNPRCTSNVRDPQLRVNEHLVNRTPLEKRHRDGHDFFGDVRRNVGRNPNRCFRSRLTAIDFVYGRFSLVGYDVFPIVSPFEDARAEERHLFKSPLGLRFELAIVEDEREQCGLRIDNFLRSAGARSHEHWRVVIEKTLVKLRHNRIDNLCNREPLDVRFENVCILIKIVTHPYGMGRTASDSTHTVQFLYVQTIASLRDT